jgi:ATP adenylyltransferase
MNYIWSPWRMDYIMNHVQGADCIFCKAVEQEDGPENLVVFRGKLAYVILNRYPYTSGHVMVVPYAHVASLEDLPPQARSEIMELATEAILVLRPAYRPEGFNLGVNLGEAAGAGILGHVHLHVVPRWGGDTNFMSSVGGTRILPESIEDSYVRIRSQWPTVITK